MKNGKKTGRSAWRHRWRMIATIAGLSFCMALVWISHFPPDGDISPAPEPSVSSEVPPVVITPDANEIIPELPPEITDTPAIRISTQNGATLLLPDKTQGVIQITPETKIAIRPYLCKDEHILLKIGSQSVMVKSGQTIDASRWVAHSSCTKGSLMLTPVIVPQDRLFQPKPLAVLSLNGQE